LANNVVPLLANAVGGALLVFGARPISDLLANLRYDPDTIPKQQISIALLLVALVAFALILTILRSLA
jgi:hypothetical protein